MRTLLTALILTASAMAADPAAAVREFYTFYGTQRVSGLPDTAQMSRLAPYLSGAMTGAIRKASAEQTRCMKAHSSEKPPWIEGDLFTSTFEGFTRIVSVAMKPGVPGQVVIAEFEYTENRQTVKWKDEVTVISASGRWVIDDIRSARGGKSLRESLVAAPSFPFALLVCPDVMSQLPERTHLLR